MENAAILPAPKGTTVAHTLKAQAASVAVVRAGGAAAALSPESVEALALTGLAVAVTLATALNQVLVIVVLGGRACPRVTLGACA